MPRFTTFVLTAFVLLMSLFQPASAQDAGRTILVLDASGSMWGQIDGKAKITIAQEVINGLLGDIPADQHLGLTAYGHRRKGDCGDIETLVEPGADTRDAISKAVNSISPRGKTPLSAAVIAAAEALKYTEEKATVILISDGKETCDFDPCEVGKQLEAAGVDFTAHVVGFDIAKPAVRAQLQCLAENTGGRFLTAANADELTKALKVVAKPTPPPAEVQIQITAIDGENGPTIFKGLIWQFQNVETGAVLVDRVAAESISLTLKPGKYRAEVLRLSDEKNAELTVMITPNGQSRFEIALPLFMPLATVEAPMQAIAGSTVLVDWTGPAGQGDYLSTARKDDRGSQTITYSYAKIPDALQLQMPPVSGDYEVRYVHNETGRILAVQDIEILPLDIFIDLPETAIAGETLKLEWRGPDYALDYLATANPEDRGSQSLTYSYTKNGAPLGLEMPANPGTFEVRYVLNQNNTVVFRQNITVTKAVVEFDIPNTATAGEAISVDWRGPDYHLDYFSVANIGDRGSQSINYTYTRDGSPLALEMPTTAGTYEVRYVLNQKNTVLDVKTIEISDLSVTMVTPPKAVAGATVSVDWKGPDYPLDYVSVAKVGDRGSRSINYTYTRGGSPLGLVMPVSPGTYEIRYVLNQDNAVVATNLIDIAAVSAALVSPTSAAPEADVFVGWSGPNYHLDYISVANIGDRGSKTIAYAYTRNGDQVSLKMPKKPGQYEIRYVLNQGNTVIATRLITVK